MQARDDMRARSAAAGNQISANSDLQALGTNPPARREALPVPLPHGTRSGHGAADARHRADRLFRHRQRPRSATAARPMSVQAAPIESPGNLFVVAAPSGAGKSSLVKALLELDSHLVVSISHTTRAPRGQEQHGREYWFVDTPTFERMVEQGDFFEWAQVHGNLYGTSRSAVEARLAAGEDVVLEIDFQGALQIKRLFHHAVLIFILPPSWEELRQRLQRRGEDRPEVIEQRMANAREEVAQARHFDFVIINALFETALFDLKTVVHSQRLKYLAQMRNKSQVFAALNLI
jgi:guanylate kinase